MIAKLDKGLGAMTSRRWILLLALPLLLVMLKVGAEVGWQERDFVLQRVDRHQAELVAQGAVRHRGKLRHYPTVRLADGVVLKVKRDAPSVSTLAAGARLAIVCRKTDPAECRVDDARWDTVLGFAAIVGIWLLGALALVWRLRR